MDENNVKQIKSKKRVTDFGEVFTNPREVNAMLDLVKDESYRVDSKFLEPACGNGNFLVEILNRKLTTVYSKVNQADQEGSQVSQEDIEKQVFIAVGSIYGIDIQEDNCEESRERMCEIILDKYRDAFSENLDENFLQSIKYVLNKNIIHGDGLTGLLELTKTPLLFSEWSFVEDSYDVTRKDFAMNDMLEYEKNIAKNEEMKNDMGSLFGIGIKTKEEKLKATKEYKPLYFKKIYTQK